MAKGWSSFCRASRPYKQWVAQNGNVELELDDVLGIKVPKPLGGKLEVDNLQLDGLVEYYQATGPIYAKAIKKLKKE